MGAFVGICTLETIRQDGRAFRCWTEEHGLVHVGDLQGRKEHKGHLSKPDDAPRLTKEAKRQEKKRKRKAEEAAAAAVRSLPSFCIVASATAEVHPVMLHAMSIRRRGLARGGKTSAPRRSSQD